MECLFNTCCFQALAREMKQYLKLLCLLLLTSTQAYAEQDNVAVIEVKLGDYKYMPGDIRLTAQQPVILRLTNTDTMTPHNFIIEDDSDGLDTNVDVSPGATVDVHLMPLVPGVHTFYCSKKFMFLDSHREKGMEGELIIEPGN